jgi:BASS family bile acid:Na+ symporter
MDRFKYLISRSNILFLLALLTGIFLPQVVEIGSVLVIPALMLTLTITLLRFPRGFFRRQVHFIPPAIWGNCMNYLILGNFIILASIFLIREEELWIGMVLIAAVPPAVTTIPLNKLFRADSSLSLTGVAGAYLGALLIIPLIGLSFLKYIPLNYWSLILPIVGLILLPLVLSRLAIEKEWDKIIEPYEGAIIDCSFFIVFYIITASNKQLIVQWPLDLFFIAIIAFASTFFFAFAIWKIGYFFHVPENKITSFLLLGTMKNCGLAGGIALTIFNKEAALPALVFAVFTFIYTNLLKYKMKHITDSSNS